MIRFITSNHNSLTRGKLASLHYAALPAKARIPSGRKKPQVSNSTLLEYPPLPEELGLEWNAPDLQSFDQLVEPVLP